jgi:N-acyl-D-amino-acid deacylase
VAQKEVVYDIVLENGRIMDPYTRADYLGYVGIKDGKIAAVFPAEEAEEEKPLQAKTRIDVSDLVISPGFIDVHTHEGLLPKTMEVFVKDGRTTMIGGNCGGSMGAVGRYLSSMEKRGILINYATYSGHITLRMRVGAKDRYTAATPEQIEAMIPLCEQDMEAGALGVSYGIEYVPGASYAEILALGQVAARYGGMTATHGRYGEKTPLAVYALWEMVRLTKDTGVPHQYSHIGSMLGYGDVMNEALDMLEFANSQGLRMLADIYSYDAWNTGLGAAVLDEGAFEKMNCRPEDLEAVSTVVIDGETVMEAGERFTQELFEKIRALVLDNKIPDPGVIGHAIKPEKISLAMQSPYVVCGSDGALAYDRVQKKPVGHPRTTSNFARFLGLWVREKGTVDLMTALFKTSTQTALHLGLSGKGRIALGADADITVFDPETIIDRAGFGESFDTPPIGIDYVIINGVLTVDKGGIVPQVKPGKVIRRTWRVPGYTKQ